MKMDEVNIAVQLGAGIWERKGEGSRFSTPKQCHYAFWPKTPVVITFRRVLQHSASPLPGLLRREKTQKEAQSGANIPLQASGKPPMTRCVLV